MMKTPYNPERKLPLGETLPCLVCRKKLDSAIKGAENHPGDGVEAITHGNYGSTVFDPVVTPHHLVFNVCDTCLEKAAKAGLVALRFPEKPLVLWTPGLEYSYP